MLYFLIQTLASFRILVFYILDYRSLFCMFLFLKLGMFPFFSWYVNVLYRFPSSLLLLSGTLHKLPPLLLLAIVVSSSNISILVVTRLVTLMVGGFFILRVLDFRYLLVVSSIANNSLFHVQYFLNLFYIVFFYVLQKSGLLKVWNCLIYFMKF